MTRERKLQMFGLVMDASKNRSCIIRFRTGTEDEDSSIYIHENPGRVGDRATVYTAEEWRCRPNPDILTYVYDPNWDAAEWRLRQILTGVDE